MFEAKLKEPFSWKKLGLYCYCTYFLVHISYFLPISNNQTHKSARSLVPHCLLWQCPHPPQQGPTLCDDDEGFCFWRPGHIVHLNWMAHHLHVCALYLVQWLILSKREINRAPTSQTSSFTQQLTIWHLEFNELFNIFIFSLH